MGKIKNLTLHPMLNGISPQKIIEFSNLKYKDLKYKACQVFKIENLKTKIIENADSVSLMTCYLL